MKLQLAVLVIGQVVGEELREERRLDELHAQPIIRTLRMLFQTGTEWPASAGHNVLTDATCAPTPTDLVVGSALLGPLSDNGGATPTHALLSGSPAIDAADAALCPATDQRGVARPQGAACDVGAVERTP